MPGQGGTEAKNSNELLHGIIRDAIVAVAPEVGPGAVSLVNTRGEIGELLKLDDVIDLVIPRGGNALVSYIQHNTRIPVMGHADGICHIYIDAAADIDAACAVVVDAKTDYPAACNAVEKVLVHEALFGPRLYKLQARGCPRRSLQGSVVRVGTQASCQLCGQLRKTVCMLAVRTLQAHRSGCSQDPQAARASQGKDHCFATGPYAAGLGADAVLIASVGNASASGASAV